MIIPPKPESELFTDEQWEAIHYTGEDILVSASAGSGKTTVLVKRVIEKIAAHVGLDQLLIVTYTEAAAREMKERIEAALRQKIDQESDAKQKQFYLQQLTLLPTAHISTLHSFCLSVIRKYYYLIDLDPSFRMLTDETEQIMLKEMIWEEVRDAYFEEEPEKLMALMDQFASDRRDNLGEVVQKLYDFSRSHPNPEEWLTSLAFSYQGIDSLKDSELFNQYLKPQLEQVVLAAKEDCQELVNLLPDELKTLKKNVKENLGILNNLHDLILNEDWDQYYAAQANLTWKRMTKTNKVKEQLLPEGLSLIDQVSASSKQVKEVSQQIFAYPPEEQCRLMKETYPFVQFLAEIVIRFAKAYRDEKRQRGVMDFSDLEHYTYAILNAGDEIKPAQLFYQEQFVELMIDEYQDINALQESIIQKISRPEGNRFMVGDVKQSIYSFRLADPQLFIEKYQSYGAGKGGHLINFQNNFRSRHEVLSLTNYIFKQLMDEEVGEMNYGRSEELICGSSYEEKEDVLPEILIYENQEGIIGDEIEDSEDGQIYLIAKKIKELMTDGYQVFDVKAKAYRPLTYRDIAILAPTKSQNLRLKEIFSDCDLPIVMTGAEDYFQATEIRQMVALLNILDNPYQDIHFVAVLRSPFVGLNEEELAGIRTVAPNLPFYEATKEALADPKWVAHYPEAQSKVQHFMNQLADWRNEAHKCKIADLIWRIYEETGFLDYVGGLVNGEQRQLNLHALYQRAEEYEQMSFKGLFQFIRFIELMQERNQDLAEPLRQEEDQDAIQSMTIHASKGLEFPVVFCLNLTKGFNDTDLNQPYVFDNQVGFGMKYLDPERRQAETIPYLAVRQAKKAKARAEDMRKLYVALTRAKEKLYLVGSYPSFDSALKKWSQDSHNEKWTLAANHRLSAQNLMTWIGLSLMRHQDMDSYQHEFAIVTSPDIKSYPTRFKVESVPTEDLLLWAQGKGKTVVVDMEQVVESQGLQQVKDLLNYQYPHHNATMTTGYQSVSEVKNIFADPDLTEMDYLATGESRKKIQQMESDKFRYLQDQLAVPKFIQTEEAVSSAEVGSATHLLFQLMDLTQEVTLASLGQLLDQQIAKGSISEAAAKFIPLKRMCALFNQPFGKRLLMDHDKVKRERAFSLLLKPSRLFSDFDGEDERLLIHGMIDGYIEYDTQVVLYDFKTNRPHKGETDQEFRQRMLKEYRGQMYLYRLALEKALHKPVTETYLVLLYDEVVYLEFKGDLYD